MLVRELQLDYVGVPNATSVLAAGTSVEVCTEDVALPSQLEEALAAAVQQRHVVDKRPAWGLKLQSQHR